MNISGLKSQNISNYITLLSNPSFIKAVKTAANEDGNSGKYEALFENLEKLAKLLSSDENQEGVSETSDAESNQLAANQFLAKSMKERLENETNQKQVESMGKLVDELIDNADLLQAAMDLDVTPSINEEINLFSKFISIIRELDEEMKKIEESVKKKEVKSVLKLRPSASTKSGFEEVMVLVVK